MITTSNNKFNSKEVNNRNQLYVDGLVVAIVVVDGLVVIVVVVVELVRADQCSVSM